MANLKSAKKKSRKDVKLTIANAAYKSKMAQILRLAQTKSLEAKGITLPEAYAVFDKAAKRNILSTQRAARLKSKISRTK